MLTSEIFTPKCYTTVSVCNWKIFNKLRIRCLLLRKFYAILLNYTKQIETIYLQGLLVMFSVFKCCFFCIWWSWYCQPSGCLLSLVNTPNLKYLRVISEMKISFSFPYLTWYYTAKCDGLYNIPERNRLNAWSLTFKEQRILYNGLIWILHYYGAAVDVNKGILGRIIKRERKKNYFTTSFRL